MIGSSVLVGLVINARRNREVPSGTRELLTEKPKHRFSPAQGAEISQPFNPADRARPGNAVSRVAV